MLVYSSSMFSSGSYGLDGVKCMCSSVFLFLCYGSISVVLMISGS